MWLSKFMFTLPEYTRVVIWRGQHNLPVFVWHLEHFFKKNLSATFIYATIQKVILTTKNIVLALCSKLPVLTFPCTALVTLQEKSMTFIPSWVLTFKIYSFSPVKCDIVEYLCSGIWHNLQSIFIEFKIYFCVV